VCQSNFCCGHGVTELKWHDKNAKHNKNMENKKNEEAKGLKNVSITESFKKAEAKSCEQRKTKDAALKAEASISNLIATHNVSTGLIDCLAELLPKIFPDSQIVKQMSLHHHKAFYTLKFGTAEHMKKKLVCQLVRWPFSPGANISSPTLLIFSFRTNLIQSLSSMHKDIFTIWNYLCSLKNTSG
jgi:hypothetical protein